MLELDKDQVQEAKEIFNRLFNVYKEKANLEILKKERENLLREELASICDVRDGGGEIQPGKIKMPLVLAVINEIYRDKENPKEIEYGMMESYKNAFKNENGLDDISEGYLHCVDEIKASAGYIKDIFKDSSLLDKDICKALEDLAKEKYKEVLSDKMVEAGLAKDKVEKDDTEYNEIKSLLEQILES